MAALNAELAALCDKVRVPQNLRDWFVANEFCDPMDISLLGADEKELVSNVTDALPGDNSIVLDLTLKVKLKKLWTLCGASSTSNPSSGPSNIAKGDEENLPDAVPEAIEAAWIKKHHFHLSGARLLIGGDYNRVYNCLMKKRPRELPKMDPEKFRLANESVSGESKGLFLTDDGKVNRKSEYFNEIFSHDTFWWKTRAFLSTVAYLTVMEPDLFLTRLA